jgi:glucose/arabinose dehydrogenase
MKKIWLLVLCLALFGAAFYFVKTYLFYDISLKGVIPAIRTPGKDVKQYLPQNSKLLYPFRLPQGYMIDTFANLGRNLPRAMVIDSEGTLLVSSTTQGKIIALPDKDKNGKADDQIVVLTGLNKPHGMAFNGDELFVAETDKIVKYSYNPTDYTVIGLGETVALLPGGGRHFTRTIKIHQGKLYISVGSSCDVCVENDERRAAILVSNLDGSDFKVYAKGLRNTVFFTFDEAGNMWGTDMGRDELGDNLPPDELNIIKEGKNYGWPYCYGDRVRDSKFKTGENISYCSETEAPVYKFPAHVAPLGISFIKSSQFSPHENGNLLVSLHGSWNSSVKVGYKIVYLSAYGGGVGAGSDYLTGFLQNDDVLGRPVDLIFDDDGNLFISDDYSGVIYIFGRG